MTCPTSLLLIYTLLLLLFPNISSSSNTLLPNQSLTDNQTLVSEGNRFELGFFSPGASKNRYLGIWYKKISPLTVVWIANRNTPITDSSGVLKWDENGNLLLVHGSSEVVWRSKQSKEENPIAEKTISRLLDTGNFVVMRESGEEDDEDSYRWQSFDYATDTLLPGMKLGWDLKTGLNNSIVSWKSADDPSADNNNKLIAIIIAVTMISLALLLGLTGCYMWRKRKLKRGAKKSVNRMKSQELPSFNMFISDARDITADHHNDDLELLLIDFDIIAATTEKFSNTNLIGHGGFGSVYKGTLADGQQIAVKRLSKASGQGLMKNFEKRILVISFLSCITEEEADLYKSSSNGKT